MILRGFFDADSSRSSLRRRSKSGRPHSKQHTRLSPGRRWCEAPDEVVCWLSNLKHCGNLGNRRRRDSRRSLRLPLPPSDRNVGHRTPIGAENRVIECKTCGSRRRGSGAVSCFTRAAAPHIQPFLARNGGPRGLAGRGPSEDTFCPVSRSWTHAVAPTAHIVTPPAHTVPPTEHAVRRSAYTLPQTAYRSADSPRRRRRRCVSTRNRPVVARVPRRRGRQGTR
jgi:hypothetical protein